MPFLQPINCDYPDCRAAALPDSRYCKPHQKPPEVKEEIRQVEKRRKQNEPWRAWYHRKPWTGENGLRARCLARDPICKVCDRNASTIVDHIRPHKGVWALFVDLLNLQGLCKACHDKKTVAEDGGFGAQPTANAPVATGETGKQFSSSSVGEDALDRALREEI